MINREYKTVQLVTYTDDIDEYGQPQQTIESTEDIEMVCIPYSKKPTDDMRYVDVEVLGITRAKVNDSQKIIIDSVPYRVLYTIPSKRFTQVLLKR